MARPTKFSLERQASLVEALSVGLYIEQACQWAGISPATYYRWMEQGQSARSGQWREFREAVEAATLRAEMAAVAVIRAAFSGPKPDWHAAEAFLKRRIPERWGNAVRVTGADGGPVAVVTREQAVNDGKERARRLRAV